MWIVTPHSLPIAIQGPPVFPVYCHRDKPPAIGWVGTGSDGDRAGQLPATQHQSLAGSVSPWMGASAPFLLSGLFRLGSERPMVEPR